MSPFPRWKAAHRKDKSPSPPTDAEVARLAQQADAILSELTAVVTRMSTMLREDER